MKRAILKGFTLIELLVVVAIIAVVGSGIAVTYQHMDQHAKIAMEVSDIAGLKKTIKHWSAVRDFSVIPDGFDLLVKQNGSTMSMYGHPPFAAATAPPSVLTHLANAGVKVGYAHLDTNPAVLNDSTFTGNFVTTSTMRTLVAGGTALWDDAMEFLDPANVAIHNAHDFDVDGPYTFTGTNGHSWTATSAAALTTLIDTTVPNLINSQPADRLAFLTTSGVGGLRILSNLGLDPSEVALGTETQADALAAGKKYYLVGMGVGRFSTLYEGRAVRLDGPPKGKRFSGKDVYSRYIVLIKVPVESPLGHGSTTGGTSEKAQIVDVLSPQGLSVPALQDNLDAEKANLAATN